MNNIEVTSISLTPQCQIYTVSKNPAPLFFVSLQVFKKMMMKKTLFALLFGFLFVFSLQAAYIERVPVALVQPNGDTLHCFATGDDFYQWLHDAKNFTIILNVETGFFVYANLVNNELVPTNLIPGVDTPENSFLTPGLNISVSKILQLREKMERPMLKNSQVRDNTNKGNMNNLVVFIRFFEEDEFTNSFAEVNQKFNDSSSVNAVSVYNYVKNVSYNQMFVSSHYFPTPVGDQIFSYQDSFPRNYYMPYSANNLIGYQNNDTINERTIREHALLIRAINYIKHSVPNTLNLDYNEDGKVDNICFVVKGNVGAWANLLWPHRWSLFTDSITINDKRVWDYNFLLANASYFSASVMSHELLHTFGFPDLYRYAYNGTPIGKWDIMASTTNPPQQTNMYMKFKYGNWIDEIPEITTEGYYTLYPSQTHKEGSVYKIASPNPEEFFVLEYRKKELPFDNTISAGGVVIYRINTLFNGNAGTNFEDVFDEVYVFRFGGTPFDDGTVNAAAFYQNSNLLNQFNPWTNPYPFLTDGTVCFFELTQFSSNAGDSITFYYAPNPISVQESKILNDVVQIYPIPTTGTINVNFLTQKSINFSYKIVDLYGKTVETGMLQESNNSIDISALANGIYFIEMKNPKETKTYKIIKQ
jgi:M6 family metalloprotease-like protein